MFNKESLNDTLEMVNALSVALDLKSEYTCNHSARVAELSVLLAKALHLPLEEQIRINLGAHLHDIGKVGKINIGTRTQFIIRNPEITVYTDFIFTLLRMIIQ